MLPKAVIFAYRDQSFSLFVGQSDLIFWTICPFPKAKLYN